MISRQYLIARYKRMRAQRYLALPDRYRHRYALVGSGAHSIDVLVPCLHHLGVPIKCVHTRTQRTAEQLANRFPGASGTADYSEVLRDDEVQGVFIAAAPSAHAALAARAVEAGKDVFVEKPPCQTLDELEHLASLEAQHGAHVVVGLQRRYAPAFRDLRRRLKEAVSYVLRYGVGAYPEGDAVKELFIHPLDAVTYLFGPARSVAGHCIGQGRAETFTLALEHEGGTAGVLELSTAHAWNASVDTLDVNTSGARYTLENVTRLVRTRYLPSVAGVPLEKVWRRGPSHHVLYGAPEPAPTARNNPLATHGYAYAVQAFLDGAEGKSHTSQSRFTDLAPTYRLLKRVAELR